MKKLFLIAVLVVSANIAFAQDKYEFMTISYEASKQIFISINGNAYLKESVELPKEEKSTFNTNPLLIKIKEYQEKGWEVTSFNTLSYPIIVHITYLRKKKTN